MKLIEWMALVGKAAILALHHRTICASDFGAQQEYPRPTHRLEATNAKDGA